MSVHAAKGLEFDCVIISGAEDELFPHARSVGDADGEEEERRLFYVAMTRARERLAVTYASQRYDWRGEGRRYPSPYLHDIPQALIRLDDRRRAWGAPRPRGLFGDRTVSGFGDGDGDGDGVDGVHDSESDVSGQDADQSVVREVGAPLGVGERVRHPYFGEGWLADRRGKGGDERVTVDFDHHGRKQLLLIHARLERVS